MCAVRGCVCERMRRHAVRRRVHPPHVESARGLHGAVQPYGNPGNLVRFREAAGITAQTCVMSWRPSSVAFSCVAGAYVRVCVCVCECVSVCVCVCVNVLSGPIACRTYACVLCAPHCVCVSRRAVHAGKRAGSARASKLHIQPDRAGRRRAPDPHEPVAGACVCGVRPRAGVRRTMGMSLRVARIEWQCVGGSCAARASARAGYVPVSWCGALRAGIYMCVKGYVTRMAL